jgi:pyrimidine dimer DNA glycosylase
MPKDDDYSLHPIFATMRIWSIHPKYLDSKGLTAVWRETLLAKKVLENKTKGYKNHPQLHRFKEAKDSLDCISQYLVEIYKESLRRNYSFDKKKFKQKVKASGLTVTTGQLDFEIQHLIAKLKKRDPKKWKEIELTNQFETHPLFTLIPGDIEPWEKVRSID